MNNVRRLRCKEVYRVKNQILSQIATLGPDPAPIAGDISYEYEDLYDYDYDNNIQNIQVSLHQSRTQERFEIYLLYA